MVGAATACQPADVEAVATVASPAAFEPRIGGVCPSDPTENAYYQAIATATFKAVGGGMTASRLVESRPCVAYASTNDEGGPTAQANAVLDYVGTVQRYFAEGRCRFVSSKAATVCGVAAIEYDLECDAPPDAEYIALNAVALDKCWGSGVSGFFWSSTTTSLTGTTTYTIHVDPEPVRLTQELSGSTGAMAAGYYVNSGSSSNVVKWPGTWTPGSVSAGAPCSTVDLAATQDAKQTIQAYGSYRKCL